MAHPVETGFRWVGGGIGAALLTYLAYSFAVAEYLTVNYNLDYQDATMYTYGTTGLVGGLVGSLVGSVLLRKLVRWGTS